MVGGVPTVTRELARGLAERGHAVQLLAPSTTGRSATSGGRLTVARRRSVRWPWYEDQRLGLLGRAAAAALVDGFAPDVVHIHSPLTLGAAARSAARRRRVPVVYTNHYLPANVHPTADRADRNGRPGWPGRCSTRLLRLPDRVRQPLRPGHRADRDRAAAAARARAAGALAGRVQRRRPGGLLARGGRRAAPAPVRAARGAAADPLGRPAQPREAGGRADRGGGRAGRAGHGARAGGLGPDEDRLRELASGAASPSGSASSASSPAPTCRACTGWRTCSRSRPRPSCSPW